MVSSSMSKVFSNDDLIEYIKRSLGYPVVQVELTDDQIQMAIDDAIQEIQPWYTSYRYVTVNVSRAIDLSEYGVLEVTDIFKVHSGDSADADSDPFYLQTQLNQGTMSIQNSQGFGRGHRFASDAIKVDRDMFYMSLSNVVRQRTAKDFKDNISYRFIDDTLYIDVGVPRSSTITIEYIPKVLEVEDFVDDDRYVRYLKDLSVAFSNILLSRIAGKYEVSTSPSTVNHDRMYQDGRDEVERIRLDLRETAMSHYITD